MSYTKTKIALNQLVADLVQGHTVLHQIHWYMRGEGFLFYHPKLDKYMDILSEQLDTVSERLITIDGSPYSTLKEFAEHTKIEDRSGQWNTSISEDMHRVSTVIRQLVGDYQQGVDAASEEGDAASEDVCTGYLRDLQKVLWMLQAEIGKAPEIER